MSKLKSPVSKTAEGKIKKIMTESGPYLNWSVEIKTPDQYAAAGEVLVKIRTYRKQIADFMTPIIDAIKAGLKIATGKMKEVDAPLEDAENRIKSLMAGFDGPAPAVEGISLRSSWSAQVYDMSLLIGAVAIGAVPADALLPNMTYLNGLARTQTALLDVPGVRAFENRSVAVSTKTEKELAS